MQPTFPLGPVDGFSGHLHYNYYLLDFTEFIFKK